MGLGNRETARQAKLTVEKGTPELVKAMDEGTVKPSVAAKLAELPKPEQKKALAGGKQGIKQATSAPARAASRMNVRACSTCIAEP